MSHISVQSLSIKFRIYHDKSSSLKDFFSTLLRQKKPSPYTDFWALDDVSFEIKAGDRVGIVGHNGAGKSTLLKTLCRIYDPAKGRIAIEGRIAPLLEIGAGFHPEFTGRENIYLNGAILGHTKKQLQAIEQDVISFAELENFIDTPVKYYSTGMYARLAFSLSTAIQPDILILDEMFAGGDVAFVQKATVRMKQMVDRANIMVFVSHNLELLRSFCNRIIWMDHGKIKRDSLGLQLLDDYQRGKEGEPFMPLLKTTQ